MWLESQVQIRIWTSGYGSEMRKRDFQIQIALWNFHFLKCSKKRTCRSWRKLLIWTWSWKIKFSNFAKFLFSQQIIQNKILTWRLFFYLFISRKWTGPEPRFLGSKIKDFHGKWNFMLPFTSISQSEQEPINVSPPAAWWVGRWGCRYWANKQFKNRSIWGKIIQMNRIKCSFVNYFCKLLRIIWRMYFSLRKIKLIDYVARNNLNYLLFDIISTRNNLDDRCWEFDFTVEMRLNFK